MLWEEFVKQAAILGVQEDWDISVQGDSICLTQKKEYIIPVREVTELPPSVALNPDKNDHDEKIRSIVVDMINEGKTYRQIADEASVSSAYIAQVKRELGLLTRQK